ncbi:MAG TPA: hypothetical protein VNQ90_13150 [Chthoniobacteraceae bacterium]|nr:hypothetical protein [Chthoniobacteraceae bacterium]
MKKHAFSALLVPAAAFLLLAGSPAQAAFEWDRHVSGTHFWSTGTNWKEGEAPALVEDAEVAFMDNNVPTSLTGYTVVLDIGEEVQTLRGGLTLSGYYNAGNPFTLNFDLNDKRLILDGGRLSFWRAAGSGVKANTWLFSHGTLQVGTADNAATIDLGTNHWSSAIATARQANSLKLGSDATFDSVNLGSLQIVANTVSLGQQFMLDLSEANLVSGSEQRTLKVADAINIGVAQSTTLNNSNNKQGELRLGELSHFQTTDLTVGRSFEGSLTSAADATSAGILRFLATQTGVLNMKVARDLQIGAGKNASGQVLDAPLKLNLTVGDAATPTAQRGVLHVGYLQSVGSTGNAGDTTSGQFIAREGSFNAYVSELKIGVNEHLRGKVDGNVDFSQMELGVLDITGDAAIGKGINAEGRLALSGGQVFSKNLVLGAATESSTGDPLWTLERSGLSLDGTLWTIENNLTIGAMGDLELRLGPDPSLAGLDIGLGLTLEAVGSQKGTLAIYFDTDGSEGMLWGLRIAGNDHDELLADYIESNQLLALGEFGSLATVFTDEQYTYYGIAAIPEPGFVTLCGAGLLILLAPRLRRLRVG